MTNLSLDQWGVITPTGEMKKPLILSDAHADYLWEQSYGRETEKRYQQQIDEFLEEEKLEEESHKKYTERNDIRIGGN